MRYASCAFEVAWLWPMPDASNPDVVLTQVVQGEPIQILREEKDWAYVLVAHYAEAGWMLVRDLGPEVDPDWLTPHREKPLHFALRYTGTPYLWGGMTKRGIDCSGLIHMAYRNRGQLIGRDSFELEAGGTRISWKQLIPGDLITYGKRGSHLEGNPVHIAFWLGNCRILHAKYIEDGSGTVRIEPEPPELYAIRRYGIRIPIA